MKPISILLALVILAATVFTSCSTNDVNDPINVINCTSSDVSVLVSALGGEYTSSELSAALSAEGRNVVVCISENGYPFDLSDFNDSGYILRRMEDDVVICAKNESACAEAVDYFATQYISDGELVFAKDLNYIHGSADRLGNVTINGNDISEYKIVIPEESDEFEDYAASIFADYLYDAGGITVEICTDAEPEGDLEIVIGNTNRDETPRDQVYGDMEYYLGLKGNDLVLEGESYMVGGGVGKLIAEYLSPEDGGDVTLDAVGEGAIYTYTPTKARSAVLMIGDGMGFNHIGLAIKKRYLDEFYAYRMPVLGESVTYSYDGVTDSAAGATALACGFKTYNSGIGLDRKYNVLQNVRELADSIGGRTAVITSDSIIGATPSGFLSHATDRNASEAIASWYPRINAEYVKGDVDWDMLEDTIKAISYIGESGDPFFMMVEESYTDKGGHSQSASTVAEAVERFNYSIAYVMEYCVCHTDTVLIITADHETGGIKENRGNYFFTFAGHTDTNVPIFAIGEGTEVFHGKANENITIASFIAKIFGDDDFGHLSDYFKN